MEINKPAAQIVFATIIGQLLFLIASPTLVEKYGANGFGLFALTYAVVSIGGNLAALKIETLIVAAREKTIAEELTAASLICVLLLSAAAFVFWKLFLQQLFKMPQGILQIEWIIFIATILQAWVNVLSSLSTRQELFGGLAVNKFMNFGVPAIVGLCWSGSSLDNGLVVSIIISAALQMMVVTIPNAKILARICYIRYKRETIKEIKSAAYLIFPANALDVFSQHLPILIISSTFGVAVVGMYSLAARIVYAPFSSISAGVSTVFLSHFSRSNNLNRRVLLIKTWKNLALMGGLIYIPVILFAPDLFKFVYGVDWVIAGEMARALGLVTLINMVFSPTSGSFIVMRLRNIPLFAATAAFGYRIGSFVVGVMMDSVLVALYIFCVFEILQIFTTNRFLIKKLN